MVVIHDLAWLNHRHDWPGLKAVAVVDSTREINGKTEKETGFYITSLTAPASSRRTGNPRPLEHREQSA